MEVHGGEGKGTEEDLLTLQEVEVRYCHVDVIRMY